MIVQKNVHVEMEMLRWLIVLAIASAFLLGVLYKTASGDDVGNEPELMPPKLVQDAKPITSVETKELKPVAPPATHAENLKLWAAIEAVGNGATAEEVAQLWQDAPLRSEAEAWRAIVLAIQDIRDGELDWAAKKLLDAENKWPDHAVVHYCLGALRLAQANRSIEWDGATPDMFRCVAWSDSLPHIDTSVAPNTPSMYEYVAMMELREAVELADKLDPNARLLNGSWTSPAADELYSSMPMEVARAGDLMSVLGLDDFEARAHGMLGRMYLRHGRMDEAYEHLHKAHPTEGYETIRRVSVDTE